jgi:hypothetical protein
MTKAYQVHVYKNNEFSSILSNDTGKTIICYKTAKSWLEKYKIRFLNCGHTDITLKIVQWY